MRIGQFSMESRAVRAPLHITAMLRAQIALVADDKNLSYNYDVIKFRNSRRILMPSVTRMDIPELRDA